MCVCVCECGGGGGGSLDVDNRRAPAARRRYLFKYPNVPARATRAAVSLYRCDTQEVEFSLAFSPLYHMLHVMCRSCRVVSCSFQLSGRCSRLALRSVAFSFPIRMPPLYLYISVLSLVLCTVQILMSSHTCRIDAYDHRCWRNTCGQDANSGNCARVSVQTY